LRYNPLEDLTKVLIQSKKVLLKGLLLLIVEVLEQPQDPLLCLKLILKLFGKLLMFAAILFMPFNTVTVLPGHLVKLHDLFLNFLHDLLNGLVPSRRLIDLLVIYFNFLDQELQIIVFPLKLIHLQAHVLDLKNQSSKLLQEFLTYCAA